MLPFKRLNEMTRIGCTGEMTMKGDYERKSPVTTFKVVDEVSAVVGETRYALERLRFEGGTYAIRAAYWTVEGRLRRNASELRVGFGQFCPMLPPDIFGALVTQAFAKGWCGSALHNENFLHNRTQGCTTGRSVTSSKRIYQ